MVERLALFLCLFFAPTSTFAQDEDGYARWLRNSTEIVINNIRRILDSHITYAERRIARSIEFRVSRSWNVNAYAYKNGEKRLVIIDLGFISSIDQVSLAYVVDNELGYAGCYEEYVKYLLDVIAENSELVSQRKSVSRRLDGVWTKAKRRGSACYGATEREFFYTEGAGDFYAGSVEGILSFMILHEIAHHVLGHVNKSSERMTFSLSQEHETAADRWAFEKGFEIRVNPIAGLASWVFLSALDGVDLTQELTSTHPLTLRRFKRMLEVVEENGDTKEYGETFGRPLDQDALEEIRNAIEKIENVLEG